MNRLAHTTAAAVAAGAFALAATAMTPLARALADEPPTATNVADHASQRTTYEQQAAEFEARAAHYAQMAADYRARIDPASKHAISYFTLANYCEQHAERYRKAALEARRAAAAE